MKELKLKRKYFEECSSKIQVKAMGKGNFLKQKKKKKKTHLVKYKIFHFTTFMSTWKFISPSASKFLWIK